MGAHDIAMPPPDAPGARLEPRLTSCHRPPAAPAAALPARLQAALQQQAVALAARHFARQPQALGVVLDGPAPRGLPPARWVDRVDGIAGQGHRGWAGLGAARRHGEPPMCLLHMGVGAPERAWSVCRAVADAVPSGSLLLLAASDPVLLRRLRDPAQLAAHHRRLRLDRLHRPHGAAGILRAAWGLAQELLRGQPPLALCEIGIDP